MGFPCVGIVDAAKLHKLLSVLLIRLFCVRLHVAKSLGVVSTFVKFSAMQGPVVHASRKLIKVLHCLCHFTIIFYVVSWQVTDPLFFIFSVFLQKASKRSRLYP